MTVIRSPIQTEIEIPKTLLIDHTDPALVIDWPGMQSGPDVIETDFSVPMYSSPVAALLDVRNYRKVSAVVAPTTKGKPYLLMGKYDSLFVNVPVPADGNAHTFDIVGPEMMMWIWGLPSFPKEEVRLYLYLTS